MSAAIAASAAAQSDAVRARSEQLIRLTSVSTDPAYEAGMHATREYLLAWFREIGLQGVQQLDGGGHLALYGAWTGAPGKPTLLIYGHYDVQPPDPMDEWINPPFEPTERNGCLFGRGASDDKGSSVIAIAAGAAYLEQTGVGAKTVIPREARAKLTMRLVAGPDPARARDLVRAHLLAQCPPGVTLNIEMRRPGSPASSLPLDHPLVRAGSTVLERLLGQKPVPVRLAATVPITAPFKQLLGIETLMFAFGLPDEDVHAPNEFFRLSSIPLGLRAWVMLLDELGRMDSAAFHTTEPSA